MNKPTLRISYTHPIHLIIRRNPRELLEIDLPPTAFFSQHLAITTALIQTLNRDNIKIPEDVSLIGFDEIPMAEFFQVPITVVKQEPYRIGVEAAKLLLEQIDAKNDRPDSARITVPCTLKKRASCQPAMD